ncbi:MAG: hypothetical protein CVV42_05360 [Candidatus Riflebacteria bacterium HGW-Riflebacteria-2]|nr:MAG: hypothetical protein CVV42_05360 [Candidatus Riflebacteria bacterium HGW-Riflebacteria-2]
MNGIETPAWVKYAGDLFFLVLFLVFLFFFKPSPPADDEWEEDIENSPEEAPNPLEKMLISDDDNSPSSAETDKEEITDSDKLSPGDR